MLYVRRREIMKRHVLSILVKNYSGVLMRVAGLFARRGYNIESLTVGTTEDLNLARITIAVQGDDYILSQIKKQLIKLYDVVKVIELKPENSVLRELVLIKVQADAHQRAAINEIVTIFRCKVIDVSPETLTVELTGDESKTNALINLLKDYGIREMVRTGVTALERGSKDIDCYDKYYNEICS